MSLFKGTAITGGLTLISRVLGFVRDLLVARLFGASPLADAYFVAFRIPNLLRSFVAEGALNSAFVPVFVSKMAQGEEQRNAAFRSAIGFVLALSGALTLLGIWLAPFLVPLIAPGFAGDSAAGADKLALTVELTRIMFPLLVCVSVVAAIGGALNALKVFGAPATAQIFMNLSLIAGALLAAHSDQPIFVLAWSVTIGGVVQILVQLPALRRARLPLLPVAKLDGAVIRPILKLLLPATLGAAVYQGTIFLATVFASLIGDGAVSWLFYADRLAQLPVGIFSIALASVLLPLLAKAKVANDTEAFNAQLTRSLRWTSFVLVPVTVWLWLSAEPLARMLFERGSFTARDSEMTALALQGLSFGLWAMSCQSMLTRAFIASSDTKTPSWLGVAGLLAYVGSAFCLTAELREFVLGSEAARFAAVLGDFGHVGLALSSSISAGLTLFICAVIARHRFESLKLGGFIASTCSALLAACAGVVAYSQAISMLGQNGIAAHSVIAQSAGVAGFAAAQLAALVLIRSRELSELRVLVASKWK